MKKKVDQFVRDQEAAHLLEWMTKRGFAGNHASFAAKAGRTRAELSQHLKTERPIPLSAVKKYAEVLQCDVSDISPRWASELSPSSNIHTPPATPQLPDSPTQQGAGPEQPPRIGERLAQYRIDNPLSNDERDVLALYRKLSADDKRRLLHYLAVKIELDQFPTSPNEPSEKPDSATPPGMRDAEPNLGPALVDLTGT